ncbi:Rpn family recombination-promoting nuclease/putative transposase [Floridanema aerugineum]|uniref:Rpn family recombination-promoting nuclease/putative transposase n=1 Tax=Floridaenema aerugineum BLCC-F46 TaxID=3153654 RepID=A0ABV4X2S5_9CYAN
MSFDNLCKLLSEKYPDRFAAWILGELPSSVQVLKTELSIEPIRADSVTFLNTSERILHLEFQVKLESEPPLPFRMLDYWTRLYRLYRKPITQVIILLLPPAEGTVIETAFVLERTRHEYRVIRLWEEDPNIFLSDIALLPLASLAATSQPEQLLAQVAQEVDRIESIAQKREVSTYIQILAGLKFNQTLLRRLFREKTMRESVIYQEILQEGRQEGLQEGRQEGRQEGLQEGRQEGFQQEAFALIVRLLTRKFGTIDEGMRSQLSTLPVALLEDLAEALLDFESIADLPVWLETHRP